MDTSAAELPSSITLIIALLTIFFSYIVVLKYNVADNFRRTRLTMTAFFFFIVATLTLSFAQYTQATLPFTIPAFFIGMLMGYFIGVRGAEERVRKEGLVHYREHFATINLHNFKKIPWWSVVNFYSIGGALVLINMVGFSTVIARSEALAVLTSAVGALLLGIIAPYLMHIWTIRASKR